MYQDIPVVSPNSWLNIHEMWQKSNEFPGEVTYLSILDSPRRYQTQAEWIEYSSLDHVRIEVMAQWKSLIFPAINWWIFP